MVWKITVYIVVNCKQIAANWGLLVMYLDIFCLGVHGWNHHDQIGAIAILDYKKWCIGKKKKIIFWINTKIKFFILSNWNAFSTDKT